MLSCPQEGQVQEELPEGFAVPQFEQKFPDAEEPHCGQVQLSADAKPKRNRVRQAARSRNANSFFIKYILLS